MARPIKATPVLKGKIAEDFLRELKEKENTPSCVTIKTVKPEVLKKIKEHGPRW
jgi:hypothetical protein